MEYDLGLDKVVEKIKKEKAESVLIQLPDGLKSRGVEIVDVLSEKLPDVDFKIWMGSCFGACDVPDSDVDLVVQFGHASWV